MQTPTYCWKWDFGFIILTHVIMSVAVSVGLIGVSALFTLGEEVESGSEVKEAYECGLDPFTYQIPPTYLHFFPIGVLFLLFDVELIVCLPISLMSISSDLRGMVWFALFVILTLGLIVEIMSGLLEWKDSPF
uniref:NADH-ubiquinone oxidoreductase chain 3 n=1 Tax=Goniodes dissimilis TaxID=186210 RepID=A0A9E9J0W9_9NEOP|nr:NADH dehydrogenase subunit 3 [Goniodes dissimilis]